MIFKGNAFNYIIVGSEEVITIKKLITATIIMMLVTFMCGCNSRSIVSQADELTMNKWSNSDKFDKEISLEFSDRKATLNLKTTNYSGKISGLAIIDEKTITINDTTLNQDFSFNYELFGDKINLEYNNNTLELKKIAVKNTQK